MEFSWSKLQEDEYSKTKIFCEQLDLIIQKDSLSSSFDYSSWKKIGEFGLLALCVPHEFGGKAYGMLDTARNFAAFGEGCDDSGLLFAAGAHAFACMVPIMLYGSDFIKQKYLKDLSSGLLIAGNAATEQMAGSDLFSMETLAIKEGDYFILNGIKSYVSNALEAKIFLVYAITEPKYGYLGLSAFIVERDTEGLTVANQHKKIGLKTSSSAQLILENCRVHSCNLIGSVNQGSEIFNQSMYWERACIFAGFLGLAERVFNKTVDYVKERKQFRKPLSQFQSVSHALVDLYCLLESAGLLLYRACWRYDQHDGAGIDIAMAKLTISEVANKICCNAIQLHGSIGYDVESSLGRYLNDVLATKIFSGPSEVQKDIIATRFGF